LRCQIGTSKFSISQGSGGRRYLPFAFTEHGIVMLSSVLSSQRAVVVNIEVVRAFVRLRQALARHSDLVKRIDELEGKVGERFAEHERNFQVVFEAVRQIIAQEDATPPIKIGFEIGAAQ
jgi:hypothetical protein